MQARNSDSDRALALFIIFAVVTVAMLAGLAWAVPTLAGWAHSGQVPPLSLPDAAAAIVHGPLYGSDPAAAYPVADRALLPGALGFWTTGGLLLMTLVAAIVGIVRELDVRMSRPVADRRWYQLRGLHAHEFGRYRTMSDLIVTGPAPDRVIVGSIARPSALIAVTGSSQIAVLAAPRVGKTSGLIIPACLEHEGPLIATSVRSDIIDETLTRRRSMGRVFVWDPFGSETCAWNLLQGCEGWEHALLVARWLGQARKVGEGIHQDYFDEEAEGLVAPLLHAAAISGDVTAQGVYSWILSRDEDTPTAILRDAGTTDAQEACERLEAVYAYTERQKDGIIGTVAIQMKAYGHPAAARTARLGEGLTPAGLFDGAPNTLFIVAGREHQQMLAPLVVTMISSLMFWLSESENRGEALNPPALLALDETAQIAPLQSLPQMLATSLPSARFMTVWHSVAQMRRHFGVDAAAEILALSQAKVFMGSITDHFTRQEVVELLGRREQLTNSEAPGRGLDVMSAQALQRTSAGEGLLIHGGLPPVVFRQRRHYLDPALQRLKGKPAGSNGTAPPREPVSGAVAGGGQQDAALAAFGQVEEKTPAVKKLTSGLRKERGSEAVALEEQERRVAGQRDLGIADSGGVEV